MRAQLTLIAHRPWLALLGSAALGLLVVHGASCSLGADLDTGPIESMQCDQDEDCPVGSVCAANDYCDPPPDPNNPPAECEFARCGPLCVDLQTDVGHCGACGAVCRGDEMCEAGACVCGAGSLDCGGACVDPQRDAAHCGACGRACAPTESCLGGTCGCLPEQARCGTQCADLRTSDTHCGACDNACGGDATCTDSACVCPNSEQAFCNNSCINVFNDKNNCGGCGVMCASGAECRQGTCRCENNPNGDICISNAPGVASAACDARTCTWTCTATAEDCNGDPSDGCEGVPGCL